MLLFVLLISAMLVCNFEVKLGEIMKKNYFILIFALLMLEGCATIVGSDSQVLPITSNPNHASVLITDETGEQVFKGTTPASINLQKSDGSYFGKKRYTVQISKNGLEQKKYVNANPSGWYIAGNLFSFGLMGWLIDPMSGSMFNLSPEKISATL